MSIGNDDGKCFWSLQDDVHRSVWSTECGNVFEFMSEGPRENDFHYCPYCGNWLLYEYTYAWEVEA